MRLGWAASAHSEKRGFGDRDRGLAQDKLPLPIAPWLQVSVGSLSI